MAGFIEWSVEIQIMTNQKPTYTYLDIQYEKGNCFP